MKYAAETFGTFVLVFAGLGTAVLAGGQVVRGKREAGAGSLRITHKISARDAAGHRPDHGAARPGHAFQEAAAVCDRGIAGHDIPPFVPAGMAQH